MTGVHSHTGQCHCGAVSYRAAGLENIWYCHCRQCRHVTGHYLATCRTAREALTVSGEVRWMPVSDKAAHGRCAQCGSPLFWSNREAPTISVHVGSLDDTSGIASVAHMFVAEKGAYYSINDGLPQYPGWPEHGV